MYGRYVEFIAGLVVVTVSLIFVVYVLLNISDRSYNNYKVYAYFEDIGNIKPGAAVVINGVKIGKVADISLDIGSFLAKLELLITADVKVPIDSMVKIVSRDLLGDIEIVIVVGENKTTATDGAILYNTRDWESLEDKIGNMLF